jgi:hypothetical protein
MQTGGFSEVARYLSEHYGRAEDDPITRQQVFQWYKRATLNAAGQPFPREYETDYTAPHGRPRKKFSLFSVLTWTEAGVPAYTKATGKFTGWRHLNEQSS